MLAAITCYFNSVGSITRYESTNSGKEFFVVEYDESPYMNLFEISKEKEALISLVDNDISTQTRDATMENLLLNDDTARLFYEDFGEIYEKTNGNLAESVKEFDEMLKGCETENDCL